jgi:probable rRNA maturation factor
VFVQVTSSQQILNVDPTQVEAIIAAILKEKQVSCDEVSIHFASIEEITQMHGDYFNDPTPTDCITFPIDDSEDEEFYKVLGEVFVCPEVALNYSKEHQVNFEEELTLYIVHGLLHLLGYDDIEEMDRSEMRQQEAHLMRLLSVHDLILKPTNSALNV